MKAFNFVGNYWLALFLIVLFLTLSLNTKAQPLIGEFGSSSRWGSGWIDLASAVNFEKGDRLKLTIGGDAKKIIIRLLPKGISPETPQSIVGGVLIVPENRIVEITLDAAYMEIIQISVHGGTSPWNMPLGNSNGLATLLAAEHIPHEN